MNSTDSHAWEQMTARLPGDSPELRAYEAVRMLKQGRLDFGPLEQFGPDLAPVVAALRLAVRASWERK